MFADRSVDPVLLRAPFCRKSQPRERSCHVNGPLQYSSTRNHTVQRVGVVHLRQQSKVRLLHVLFYMKLGIGVPPSGVSYEFLNSGIFWLISLWVQRKVTNFLFLIQKVSKIFEESPLSFLIFWPRRV